MYSSVPTQISLWQLAMLSMGILMGTSTLLPSGAPAGKDAWLAVLLAAGAGILSVFLWQGLVNTCAAVVVRTGSVGSGRRTAQLPGAEEGLWTKAFGPRIGRVVAALYFAHFTHWAAIMLSEMTYLIGLEVLPRTPVGVLLFVLVGLAVWAVSSGPEAMARLAETVMPLVFLASALILILAFVTAGLVDMTQLRPVLENGYRPLFHGVLHSLAFPFGELVVLLPLALSLPQPARAAVPWRWAILLVSPLLASMEVRNVAVLGAQEAARFVYPGLAVARLIEFGRVIQRVETIAILVWVNAGFVKLTAVLLGASFSLRELLDARLHAQMPPVVLAIGLVAGSLSAGLFDNPAELVSFSRGIWPVYAPIFQLVIPGIALMAARVRSRSPKGNEKPQIGRRRVT